MRKSRSSLVLPILHQLSQRAAFLSKAKSVFFLVHLVTSAALLLFRGYYCLYEITFMLKSSNEQSLLDRIRSSARKAKAHALPNPDPIGSEPPVVPLANPPLNSTHASTPLNANEKQHASHHVSSSGALDGGDVADKISSQLPPPAPPPAEKGHGEASSALGPGDKPNIGIRFYTVLKETLMSSWVNVLLIFVPVGIAVQAAGINPTIVFAMNAIAIVPLAGLLSHATESVASEMGDTIGALMNVTFGNAVELIIL